MVVLRLVNCFIQCQVVGSQSCWTVFSHVIQGRPGGLFQFSGGGAVRIILAYTSSSICAMCPNKKKTPWLNCRCNVRLLRYPPHLTLVVAVGNWQMHVGCKLTLVTSDSVLTHRWFCCFFVSRLWHCKVNHCFVIPCQISPWSIQGCEFMTLKLWKWRILKMYYMCTGIKLA